MEHDIRSRKGGGGFDHGFHGFTNLREWMSIGEKLVGGEKNEPQMDAMGASGGSGFREAESNGCEEEGDGFE